MKYRLFRVGKKTYHKAHKGDTESAKKKIDLRIKINDFWFVNECSINNLKLKNQKYF